MRTAVIADIHSNLEALQSVLERIRELAVDEIVCLGDIVGYNADPNACMELVRSARIDCVLGNHDVAAAGLAEPDRFTSHARAALSWTREHLSTENLQFLASLPYEKNLRGLFLFHGSVHNVNRYMLSRRDAESNFLLLDGMPEKPRIGFFGHTHEPAVLTDAYGSEQARGMVSLCDTPARRYFINPGSVGQPRDGNPRAAFLVYDGQAQQITFYRAEYDVKACQDKIRKAGLPETLAERLERGR